MLKKLKQDGKKDLFDQYGRAGQEFDKMTEDLESKINGITDDLADLVRNLDDKKAALQAQEKLNLLNDKRRKNDSLEKSRQDLLD